MKSDRFYFLLLNIGHFLDHLFMLIFATVAALALHKEWGVGYAGLLIYATPGFFAFGLFSLPAGWMADRWSRDGMMVVFFVGIGVSSIATSFVGSPFQIGIGLFAIGVFAAIYHPVGLAIVTMRWKNTGMRLAANGVWGNLGVASAALVTGYLIDNTGWRAAFFLPGLASIAIGLIYLVARPDAMAFDTTEAQSSNVPSAPITNDYRVTIFKISAIVFLTTAVSSVIFQSTTFALPKIFDERLTGLVSDASNWIGSFGNDTTSRSPSASIVGGLAFLVFSVASIAQLIVGSLLDRYGPKPVFMVVAAMQLVFFALMPKVTDGLALLVALGFMLGAFGQIPINDFMIGKMASGAYRARIYGTRYLVAFSVLAITLPLVSYVYEVWGFDTLFRILAGSAFVILCAVALLPRSLPTAPVSRG